MLILAFETSAKAGSVALLEGDRLLGENYQNTGLTHSQTLLSMAEALISHCGYTPQDIDFDINYYMAVCHYKMGESEKAIERYNSILALRPKSVDAYFQ